MKSSSNFCTCTKTDCHLHPTQHDKGCAPCVSKNLGSREMPSCFFNLLDGSELRSGDSFKDFAEMVLKSSVPPDSQ